VQLLAHISDRGRQEGHGFGVLAPKSWDGLSTKILSGTFFSPILPLAQKWSGSSVFIFKRASHGDFPLEKTNFF